MIPEIDFKYFFLINFVLKADSVPIDIDLSKSAGKYDIDAHLNFEHVKNICSNSVAICKSNDSNVCATRLYNDKMEYEDYENSCFLFINNMCHNYGNEFSIISTGSCSDYFKYRRSDVTEDKKNIKTASDKTMTVVISNTTSSSSSATPTSEVTKKPIKRSETTMSTLYDIDTAFDFHMCPLSCPNVYSPVCVGVNRGYGLYYKFYTFVNHCSGDLYYCKNWREFSPPPDEEEMVKSSPLSWSYCAANSTSGGCMLIHSIRTILGNDVIDGSLWMAGW
ncbi:uncharacterized protein LOC126780081 isoform X2 [Nymphalis io]|uniref:uncharacterized protein LOC126780081 isoform X2 n=1 Tax=Inachis io TaxID=171585 RepID=UPI002167C9EE|nr:uncharacterized protein LOC126780081 isoform X2 [Nymphalis io]